MVLCGELDFKNSMHTRINLELNYKHYKCSLFVLVFMLTYKKKQFFTRILMQTNTVDLLPRKPKSKNKFINKMHHGDCIKIMDSMPKSSVGVVVTSPPYNLKNSTGNGMKDGRGGKWSNAALLDGYSNYNDNMPHEDYVNWQRRCLDSMMRVLRDDGAIFYNHKWRVQNGLLQDRNDILDGFPVRQIIIWKRNGGINFNRGYFLPTFEVIYLIAKKDFKLAPKANAMGDVWKIKQTRDNPHPAPFPIELAERCVSSTMADVVLDPFMGSGTTALASINNGRKWIGIDISKEYCKMTLDRIESAGTQW